jgi:hypothetical protein
MEVADARSQTKSLREIADRLNAQGQPHWLKTERGCGTLKAQRLFV